MCIRDSVYMALIHFRLGDNDRGFEWLDKAMEAGDHWVEFIKVFPASTTPAAIRATPS